MSSVQHLREFIRQRLNAAAEEIFSEFEKIIVHHEEEIDRQRKLLDITWKPQRNIHTAEVLHDHVCKVDETDQEDQQLCNQKLNSDLDQEQPESVHIKEEVEELLTSREEELLLKDETENVSITAAHAENIHSNPKLNRKHIPFYTSPADDDLRVKENRVADSGPAKFTAHVRFHTDEKPYYCQACGKCFRRNYNFLRHLQIHTGEKPHACKTCGKCFGRKYNLVCHMRTHTGEKPYSCKTCGKCFRFPSDCWRHMKTHKREKPYSS